MAKRKRKNSSVLCISDMHVPYHHPDTFKFLAAVKKKYKPDRIICLGDEVDHHALSFHDSDPDLPSASDELCLAIEDLQPLYKLFPNMDLISSNHGDMVYRKGKHHGIPMKYLRDYGDVLDAPADWKWHRSLVIKLSNGQQCYFHHGLKKDGLKLAQQMGMCTVQGHYHTEFNIKYTSSPAQLYWAMQVGCSLDDHSLAYAYNKTTMGRPILGHGIIVDGIPKLLPMVIDKKHRWIGVVP